MFGSCVAKSMDLIAPIWCFIETWSELGGKLKKISKKLYISWLIHDNLQCVKLF